MILGFVFKILVMMLWCKFVSFVFLFFLCGNRIRLVFFNMWIVFNVRCLGLLELMLIRDSLII